MRIARAQSRQAEVRWFRRRALMAVGVVRVALRMTEDCGADVGGCRGYLIAFIVRCESIFAMPGAWVSLLVTNCS